MKTLYSLIYYIFLVLNIAYSQGLQKDNNGIPQWYNNPLEIKDHVVVVGMGEGRVEALLNCLYSLSEYSYSTINNTDGTVANRYYTSTEIVIDADFLTKLSNGKISLEGLTKLFVEEISMDVDAFLVESISSMIKLNSEDGFSAELLYEDNSRGGVSNTLTYFKYNGTNSTADDIFRDLDALGFQFKHGIDSQGRHYLLLSIEEKVIRGKQ
jgi:hypothetical protein|tara:strand:+ start:455 stop:1087 length:633 start_codon:yes stop_codon:yes gene_type:complete